jgi:hypothetical protein
VKIDSTVADSIILSFVNLLLGALALLLFFFTRSVWGPGFVLDFPPATIGHPAVLSWPRPFETNDAKAGC